jgi:glucose-6-phosphate 1-dehydrogenase
MTGDASLFARADEIELSWQIIDPIQAGWDRDAEEVPEAGVWRVDTAPPLEFYEQNSWGPVGAERLLASSGCAWRLGCCHERRVR